MLSGGGAGAGGLGEPAPRLGVVGWPVAHSRSPAIQNAALAAAGLSHWRYQLLPVAPGLLAELIGALPGAHFRGVNVTIPHKPAALALATMPTPRARAIGAANTLTFEPGGEIVADNTDAPALTAALPFSAAGRTALVLGAGGSARAAVWALLDRGAREVRVWNRNPARARQLCEELGGSPVEVAEPADVLVNCTAVGLDREDAVAAFSRLPLDADGLRDFGCVVDLVYAPPHATELVRAAAARGVPTIDGLKILIGQGALSFEQFTGRPASLAAMGAAVGRSDGS